MCDERVGTEVETPEGWRDFQDYFVRRRHEDRVTQVRFAGIEHARVTPEIAEALATADAIIFCPSNPLVSIGPILAVPGVRDALAASPAVKIAVSPIVGGKALKGPADRMLAEQGMEVSAYGVATGYVGMLDAMTIDTLDAADAPRIEALGMAVQVAQTVMRKRSRTGSNWPAMCSPSRASCSARGNRWRERAYSRADPGEGARQCEESPHAALQRP